MREKEKALAITLRKQGKTYSEIRAVVPVAKSTLSEWFKSVGLAEPQKQRITQARIDGALRGAQARRMKRLAEVDALITQGVKDIGILSKRELWLIGIALHWAEGAKQRYSSISTGIKFTNSDPEMLRVFLKWLEAVGVSDKDIAYELYAHEIRKMEIPFFLKWWRKELQISKKVHIPIYFKKEKIKTNRKNTEDLYHGLIRIKVRASTSLNRQINGWIQGIVRQ